MPAAGNPGDKPRGGWELWLELQHEVLGISLRANVGLGQLGQPWLAGWLVDWLERLTEHLPSAVKVERESNKWRSLVPLTLEKVPAVPFLFGRCCRGGKWISFPYSLGAL